MPCSVNKPAPSVEMVHQYHQRHLLTVAVLLCLSAASFFLIPTDLDINHISFATRLLMFTCGFSFVGGLFLLLDTLIPSHNQIDKRLCRPLLDASRLYPVVRAYIDQVSAQGRALHPAEGRMLMDIYNTMNPDGDEVACKLLYDLT